MKITRFEELQCWQEARKLVNSMVRRNPELQKDLRLSGQITAAAVSSMSNMSEGFSRRSNKESESYVALDQKYLSQSDFQAIYEQAEKVSKLDSGLITYLLENEKKRKKLQKG